MNSNRVMLRVLILSIILLAGATIASAQSLSPLVYVSPLGSDSNTGGRTSPVRTITHALALVQPGGEVILLDSGDYDQFTINKAVTVESAPGAIAVIPDLNYSTAISVSAHASDIVVLRGLTITAFGQSGPYGIQCLQGTLMVENCVINGQFNYGIYADNTRLFVKGTAVVGCFNYGIFVVSTSSTPSIATIEHCRLDKNYYGLTAYYNSKVTVRDTVASGNGGRGLQALGFNGYTSELNVEHCVATGNTTGIATDNSSGGTVIVRVSDSTATDNGYGFYAYGGTSFYSLGNNMIGGSTTGDVGGAALITLRSY